MKRYIKSGKLCPPYKMVGEYDSGTVRTVCGDSEEECIEDLYNWGEENEGSALINYYGANDEYYVDGERIFCSTSIKAARTPWRVTVTYDSGDAETGPMIDGYDMLVWAGSKDEAESYVLEEFEDPDSVDGIYAEPADSAYVDLATREAEDEQWIDEQEAWNAHAMDYNSGPEDEEQHAWESQYHSWQQVYDEMQGMNDDEAYDFYHRANRNPYFNRAWIEYNK